MYLLYHNFLKMDSYFSFFLISSTQLMAAPEHVKFSPAFFKRLWGWRGQSPFPGRRSGRNTPKTNKIAEKKTSVQTLVQPHGGAICSQRKWKARRKCILIPACFFVSVCGNCFTRCGGAFAHRSGTLGNPSLGFPTGKRPTGTFALPS